MEKMLTVVAFIVSVVCFCSQYIVFVDSAYDFISENGCETDLISESGVLTNESTLTSSSGMHWPLERVKRLTEENSNFNFVGFNLSQVLLSKETAKKMEDSFQEVFGTLNRHLRAVSNVQETMDLMLTDSIDGFQSFHQGKKQGTEQITAEIENASKTVDKNFGYFLEIFKVTIKSYNAVEKTRLEMLDDFHKSFEYAAKSTRIESTLTKMHDFISYFASEKAKISQLPRKRRIAILTEENGLLKYLRETRTPSGGSLRTFLYEVIDKKYAIPQKSDDHVAYAALSSMYYGVVTFISVFRYMTTVNIYVMDNYYRNRDIDKFNRQGDHLIEDFESFHDAMIGNRGLVDEAVRILKDVAHRNFTRSAKGSPEELLKRAAFLEQERVRLENVATALPIIREDPGKLSGKFKFDGRSLPTPIGQWRDGAKVSYAVQYVNTEGMFSKVGEWSEPFTVNGRANPRLRLAVKSKYTKFVFRKFDNDKPQWVGVYEPKTPGGFRDIDSDLFNTASRPDEMLAIADAASLISVGAYTETHFELGRTAVHAAATIGNTELARKLLLNDTFTIDAKDTNDYTPLHIAAEGGWTDFVKMMIERGADINAKTKAGSTPLHLAISDGFTDVVKVFLQTEGVDVNAQDNKGAGPLHIAVLRNEEASVNALLADDRTNVNLQNTMGGLTPLHLSILMNRLKSTKKLIADHRTRINVRSHGNLTALHYCVISGNMPALQMLVDLDATDLHAQSVNDWTPLHYAVCQRRKEVVSVLLKLQYLSVDIPGVGHFTPLHIAAATDQIELISELLSHGARIDYPNNEGVTALHLAAVNNHTDAIKVLLDNDADVNARTLNGTTVLHIILAGRCDQQIVRLFLKSTKLRLNVRNNDEDTPIDIAEKKGHTECAKLVRNKIDELSSDMIEAAKSGKLHDVESLVLRGANVESKDNNTCGNVRTALMWAAWRGDLDIVRYLLEKGALQARDGVSQTALMWAAWGGHLDTVRYLVEKGAQLEAKDDTGQTALMYVAWGGRLDIVRYLLDKGAVLEAKDDLGQTALMWAAWFGHLNIVRYLLDKGAVLEAKDNKGETALMKAAWQDHVDTLAYMLAEGALLEARDNNKETALIKAAAKGRLNTVKYLLDKGAPLEAKNKYGFTALIGAIWEDHLDTIKYLLEKGAQLEAKDVNGHTALWWANYHGRTEIAKYLKSKGATS